MKLKNKMNDVRALTDNGKFIEVGPHEIIEIDRPSFNEKVFEIVDDQKSMKKKTLDVVKNEKLNKEKNK